MENLIGAILWDIEAGEQGAVSDRLRNILGDDYDLIPSDLEDGLMKF